MLRGLLVEKNTNRRESERLRKYYKNSRETVTFYLFIDLKKKEETPSDFALLGSLSCHNMCHVP